MAEELCVELRENTGTNNTRRLRKAGSVPAVLYGHKQDTICLAVPADQLETAVRRGSRLVDLTGAVKESAFIRELQWDTWGMHVLHVDFTRITADERIEVQVPIELRGEAPGTREGGKVEQLIHELTLDCPAGAIPEKIQVNINHLNLDETIAVAILELPEGASCLTGLDEVIVQCVLPLEMPEDDLGEGMPGEPEVIGAKEDEEQAG